MPEARPPRTESDQDTFCRSSGGQLHIFLPNCRKWRPSKDISTALLGGPTAWEARLAGDRLIETFVREPPTTFRMRAPGSPGPAGLTPLKTLLARPSQKLRKLKMALIAEGVFRPVTCRTF